MHTTLRLTFCLLILSLLAPAPDSLAKDKKDTRPDSSEVPAKPDLHEFSEEELSTARETLAALRPEQRALVNHLRYLMRPQYEDELMAGRAFAPCPLPRFEQPGAEFGTPEALRLWAVLSSGMPVTNSTSHWLQLFLDSPLPAGSNSLSEYGLQLAVCVYGVRRSELGLGDELSNRADELLEAAMKLRRVTGENSKLIVGKTIDPKWYGNQLWRALISRFALELDLKYNKRVWETAARNLLGASNKESGWQSKFSSNNETQDLDTNLFSIAALCLATTAPEGTLGKGIARSIEKKLKIAPGVLKRLAEDYTETPYVGTRLAMISSFSADLAPEGSDPDAWRMLIKQQAIELPNLSGAVLDGGSVGRELELADSRRTLRVVETALACVALGGGLIGNSQPLADLDLAAIGRAMHACSVIHASELPEGIHRSANGHELPQTGAIDRFILNGVEFLVKAQGDDGGWGSGAAQQPGQKGTSNPGSTAFAAMALMRAGHTPFAGKHKEAVLKATEYVVEVVEKAEEEGPRITAVAHTQLQRKLGQIVDTSIATQFLARVLHHTESDRALHARVEEALDKCVRKIEGSQGEDGSWITQGWAPVLQSAMNNQALELAVLAGCEVDHSVIERSREYLGSTLTDEQGNTTSKPKRSVSAGVAFYAGAAASRATAANAAEVMIAVERAKDARVLPQQAEINDKNLRKIGYDSDKASLKATAYLQFQTMLEKLEDEKYLQGFGNNGGEEFISYMMTSESIVITGDETWTKWNEKLHAMFEKIQNTDGSWSGHHCISSPLICTSAVILCLTSDRAVHVMLEDAPPLKSKGAKKADAKEHNEKGKSPVTGK